MTLHPSAGGMKFFVFFDPIEVLSVFVQ